MPSTKGDGSVQSLAATYVVAVVMRAIPTLIVGGIPFWDPYLYLGIVRSNPIRVDTTGYFPYYHLFVLYFYKAAQVDPLTYIRFLPPFLNSLAVLVMYYAADFLWGSRRAGMRAALLFAVTDITVLRQSYAVSEGLSLVFYAGLWLGMMGFVRRPERKYLILSMVMLYTLGGTHGLPFALFFPTAILASMLKGFKNRQLNVVAAASAIVFAFWLTQEYYSLFVMDYLRSFRELLVSKTVAAPSHITGQYIVVPKSRAQFVAEHASTLIVASLAAICAVDLAFQFRSKLSLDPAKAVIFSASLVTSLFLANNMLMDMKCVVGGYASAYRAWLPLAQVLILLASKPLAIAENIHPKFGKLVLACIFATCAASTLLFIENYVGEFPHLM
ncbi:MAG: hypothetical protein JTT11_04100, partial [Candidatus Brockarchaeota archaeon]|nr:hypothetical protein [Candidatus Brockarchaeota archaeon]